MCIPHGALHAISSSGRCAQAPRQPEPKQRPVAAGEGTGPQPVQRGGGGPGLRGECPAGRTLGGGEPERDRGLQPPHRYAGRVQRWTQDLLMTAYSVFENPNPRTKAVVPFLLDVQSELLSTLGTRVVVPLYRPATADVQAMSR